VGRKKQQRTASSVMLGREVRVKSVDLYVSARAEKQRGEPPKVDSKPWLIVNGELDEPIKNVRTVSITVVREAIEEPWATVPPSIGSVIGMRGSMDLVVDVPPHEFAYVWSLAASDNLRFCWLALTEPVRGHARVVTVQFSNRSGNDEPLSEPSEGEQASSTN
jgi:hypothetical protein